MPRRVAVVRTPLAFAAVFAVPRVTLEGGRRIG
jgi:hypothetical protein